MQQTSIKILITLEELCWKVKVLRTLTATLMWRMMHINIDRLKELEPSAYFPRTLTHPNAHSQIIKKKYFERKGQSLYRTWNGLCSPTEMDFFLSSTGEARASVERSARMCDAALCLCLVLKWLIKDSEVLCEAVIRLNYKGFVASLLLSLCSAPFSLSFDDMKWVQVGAEMDRHKDTHGEIAWKWEGEGD